VTGEAESLSTIAILPVKRLDMAHARLQESVPQPVRQALAEAMFLDTLAKLRRSRCIDEVLIVTADDSVERQARWHDHPVLKQKGDRGHSEAAVAGAEHAKAEGADRVAMLPIDCPLMDIAELDDQLGNTLRAVIIVPDGHGTGTNALVLSPPDAFEPAFGPESCARHVSRARAAGISFALAELESMALDLDTREDMVALREALLLDSEAAPQTAKLLWELGNTLAPAAA
jgi:2-phospho-L-lactate/phosphoenolpyruvate guanylyltransferase